MLSDVSCPDRTGAYEVASPTSSFFLSPTVGASSLHRRNSSLTIPPVPSCTLCTSTTPAFFLRLTLYTPSPTTVSFKNAKKSAAKFMHVLPSQHFVPLRTIPGIFPVSNSCTPLRIPCLLRHPTIIFGTPRRNDCAQNLSSLRSNLRTLWCEGFGGSSSDVLSSTQGMGVVESVAGFGPDRPSTSPPRSSVCGPNDVLTIEQC
jgi:hypothetical protein